MTILLMSLFSATASASEDVPKNPNVNSIKIQYVAKTLDEKYYIQFKACIGQEHVKNPTFTITSDKSSKDVKFDKLQLANTCKNYETTIKAKHVGSIVISMPVEAVKK